jgi:hypothetical protein
MRPKWRQALGPSTAPSRNVRKHFCARTIYEPCLRCAAGGAFKDFSPIFEATIGIIFTSSSAVVHNRWDPSCGLKLAG